jgi:hypothetical protein
MTLSVGAARSQPSERRITIAARPRDILVIPGSVALTSRGVVLGRRGLDVQPISKPHRDQRGVQPVLEREAHAEVGRQAER